MYKRVIHYAILLAVIIVVNFFLPRALPGSPIGTLLGDDPGAMVAEEKMGILEAYNLDKPLITQFFIYLKDLFTFNWGVSYSKKQPIFALISSSIGWTVLLAITNLIISSIVGTFLGALSALRRKKKQDLPIVLSTSFLSSLPPFWVAIFMISVVGVKLKIFPIYGAYSMWSNYTGIMSILDIAWHMVLPVSTMVITSLMMFFTPSRFGVLDAMNQDFVKMAHLRALPKNHINIFYIVRNALIPVFTVFMMDIGYLLSGSILIETIFSYPGLGTLMFDAVSARDYPLIQYSFLLTSFVTIVTLFITDILYKKIDPNMETYDEK